MKKFLKRAMSNFLVLSLLMSLIQLPSFASTSDSSVGPQFRDKKIVYTTAVKTHRDWIAPYGDEVSHYDYYATDSSPVTYSLSKAGNIDIDPATAWIDPDGIVSVSANFVNENSFYVTATSESGYNRGGNINLISTTPYIHNFDTDPYCLSDGILYDTEDTSSDIFENAAIKKEGNNSYMVAADSANNVIGFRKHYINSTADSGIMNSTILVADVYLSSAEAFTFRFRRSASSADAYLEWNPATGTVTNPHTSEKFTSVEPGWHSIKFMLAGHRLASTNTNPYRSANQRYALFFDDELLTATRDTKNNYNTYIKNNANRQARIEFVGAEGIDNFKYYGSSTPHAYGVGLESSPKSGGTYNGTALMHAIGTGTKDFTNADTHFIYSYYVSDSADENANYTKVTSKNTDDALYVNAQGKLVINSDCTGRYIKVGARVYNRGGMSPEVMSKQAYKIEGYTGDFLPPYVVYDASKQTGTKIVQFEGKTAYKFGPGGDNLRQGLGVKFTAPTEKYKNLVIEIYSKKKNLHPFTFLIYGVNNPDTDGNDYYKIGFNANWEGEWKKVKLPISGGFNDMGNCVSVRNPIRKPYETSQLTLSASLNESSSFFYEDTEMYISKIYFEGTGEDETALNAETGEYILPDQYNPSVMTDYVAMLKERYPNKSHPRILVTDEKIQSLKSLIETNEFIKTTYGKIKERADAYLTTDPEPPQYIKNDAIAYSRNVESIAKDCGMMYLLTGEDKYAARIWEEAEVMLDSSTFNLNTSEFWYDTSTGLDAGHIANGMGLLYDWCYDYLNNDQKIAIRNAVMKQAMVFAKKINNGGGFLGFRNNVAAANSRGFMTPVLAFCDEPGYEDFCNEYINSVVDYLPMSIEHQFRPDGNYAEGINYWRYAVVSLMYLSDAMNSALGSDFGISDIEGLDKTGYFPFALRGSRGMFNYSDSGSNAHQNLSPVFFYLAERYDIPALRAYRLATISTDTSNPYAMEDLVWYNPALPDDTDWKSALPKDFFIDGLVPIASMRSAYGENERYVGAKGGNTKVGHCQYDAGTFVFDGIGTSGIRWIMDLGAETYGPKLPDNHYYRVRTEGQNCIVFNPSEAVGQTIAKNEHDTRCPIVDSGASENEAFAVFDLQPSYQEYVESYSRGFALVNNRQQLIVQDKFSAKEPSEIYSFFHTNKGTSDKNGIRMSINPDGKSITLLSRPGNQECRVDFITDIDFELGIMEAVGLPTSPSIDSAVTGIEYDGISNATVHKFYLHAENVKDATITVVFTPIQKGDTVALPEIKSMNQWHDYLGGDYARHSDIVIQSVDGSTVTYTTNHSITGNKKIILASYKNDVLVSVKSATVSIDSYLNNQYTTSGVSRSLKKYTIEGFDPGDHDTIKAFIWDNLTSTLKPLSLVKEIK